MRLLKPQIIYILLVYVFSLNSKYLARYNLALQELHRRADRLVVMAWSSSLVNLNIEQYKRLQPSDLAKA